MVSNLYPPVVVGGYEVECRDVVEHLRESHDVRVLTSDRDRGSLPHEPGVVRALPWVAHDRRASLAAPVSTLRGVQVMRLALERIRPDLVWVWNGAQIPQAALRVLALSGVPVAFRVCEHWFTQLYETDVFLRHLRPGERGPRGAWARAMRAVNRLPELRLELGTPAPAAVSWNARAVRDVRPAPPSVAIVHEDLTYPSNARTAAFAAIERRPAAPDRPELVFVGRLDDAKGAETPIRALARLRAQGRDVTLALVGEGPRRAALEALAAELRLSAATTFTGPLRGEDLFAVVGRAAAWVVPSVWPEPAPLVCTEAALSRTPAVLSRVGGIGEMLREEEHALFFEGGDAEGCAAAVARTLDDPEATAGRVERARRRGEELGFEPYLEAMDAFLGAAVRALGPVR